MKIACISVSRVPSTTANSIQAMKACQAISQLGHELQLYLPGHENPSIDTDVMTFYGLKSPFPIERLPDNSRLHRYDFAFQAVRKARLLNADISYVWLIQAGIFSLLAGLPVILELHGPPEGKFGPTIFRLFQGIPGKKRILPISHSLATQIHKRFNFPVGNSSSIRISPNGVDLDRYIDLPGPSVAREQLGLPPVLTAGYTGHLYPGRGMTLLVELARRFPQVSFIWVGGQPAEVKKWNEILVTENIKNISITGFVPISQVPLFQAAADFLLMPYEKVITGSSGGDSSTYASPMKMFEYMASKRAIISSDLPVIREVLNPNNAMLVPPEDIDAWTQALRTLITSEEKRLTVAHQAWLDVQKHTWLERARFALAQFVNG